MNYLRTSRVVVIDDERAEAIPIIEGLGRLGIGCAYFPGNRVEDLPVQSLPGVRLVFLDMQLENVGSEREIGAHTARVFSRIIDPSGIPIFVVLWTKHPNLVDAFKHALFEQVPAFRAALLVTQIEKPEEAANIDTGKVLQQIVQVLNEMFPLDFIWLWEQLAHNATSRTTSALGQLVSLRTGVPPAGTDDAAHVAKWLEQLRIVFRYLLRVAAGSNITPDMAGRDVLEVLAAMQQDRLEHEIAAVEAANLAPLLEQEGARPSTDEVAAINTMLLAAPPYGGIESVRPGSVFVPSQELREGCLFVQCGVDLQLLAKEILRPTGDSEFEKAYRKLNEARSRSQATDELQRQCDEHFARIMKQCVPVLLEITPACDYAQRNRHVLKFCGGMLIPDNAKSLRGDKGSLLNVEPITPPNIGGIWHLVLSNRLLFCYPISSGPIRARPLFRLRNGLLIDILSWHGAQSARPGYMSLRAK